MNELAIQSQITFLYYRDLDRAACFYEDVLKFPICDDQQSAKIYRVSSNSFIGIVDERKGHCRAQEMNAVLITFVVNDVDEWYEYLKNCGVKLLSEIQEPEFFPVRCFFFEDPEGYQYEVQKFLQPETAKKFVGE